MNDDLLAEDPLVSLTEAASALGISRSTLRRYVDAGEIEPHWRTGGGHLRFRVKQLAADITAMRRRARGAPTAPAPGAALPTPPQA